MGEKEDQRREQRGQIPGEASRLFPVNLWEANLWEASLWEASHLFQASLSQSPPLQTLFWRTLSTVTIMQMVCSGKTFYLAGLFMIKR